MRWVLTTIGLLAAAPGYAQGLIAPTQTYSSAPSSLEKNYGMPSFGLPGSELPKQRTQAPQPQKPADPDFFAGGNGFALRRHGATESATTMGAKPSIRPTLASPNSASQSQRTSVTADPVPDFFAGGPRFVLPRSHGSDGDDTPLYTTTDGSTVSGGSTNGPSDTK